MISDACAKVASGADTGISAARAPYKKSGISIDITLSFERSINFTFFGLFGIPKEGFETSGFVTINFTILSAIILL